MSNETSSTAGERIKRIYNDWLVHPSIKWAANSSKVFWGLTQKSKPLSCAEHIDHEYALSGKIRRIRSPFS